MEPKGVKLQRTLNRKDKKTGAEFYRYRLDIPPEIVKDLKWKDKEELVFETFQGKHLIIKKKRD